MKLSLSFFVIALFFGMNLNSDGGLLPGLNLGLGLDENLDPQVKLDLNLDGESATDVSFTPGWHEGSFMHNGIERVFRVYVPEGLSNDPAAVVLLHGGSRSMNEIFRKNAGGTKEWPEVAEDEGFLLLVPNGTGTLLGTPRGNNQQWNDCRPSGSDADDVGFISALIDWADQNGGIDNDRVYVTGVSNGGVMAYRLARELDGKIAAVAAFVANKPRNGECSDAGGPMPMMIVDGTEDSTMPYDGGRVSIGFRGKVLSAEETVAYWTEQNGVSNEPASQEALPDLVGNDGSQVVRYRYGSENLGAPVVFYKVIGGGHFMPSQDHRVPRWTERFLGNQNNDVEGARIAWKFLSQFTRS